jgi:hypothetical protein
MDIKYLIKEKIKNEINNSKNIEVGIINKNNIYNFLIEPIYEEYIDANNEKIMLWTVFKGDFSNEIVYSEKDKNFGLVMTSIENEKIFLGIYGTFIETLYSI